ncbi:MAG: hypothetical protein ACI89X_003164, partial [Planctomycetota bacterium]
PPRNVAYDAIQQATKVALRRIRSLDEAVRLERLNKRLLCRIVDIT